MKLTKENMPNICPIPMTERPWGNFLLFADNRKCTTKILRVKRGEMLSLQYHFRRSQIYFLLTGDFIIDFSDKPVPQDIIINPDEDYRVNYFGKFLKEHMVTVRADKFDTFYFDKRIIHRAHYIGKEEYGIFLDVALGMEEGDENDELDIVRIKDKYNRQPILK